MRLHLQLIDCEKAHKNANLRVCNSNLTGASLVIYIIRASKKWSIYFMSASAATRHRQMWRVAQTGWVPYY